MPSEYAKVNKKEKEKKKRAKNKRNAWNRGEKKNLMWKISSFLREKKSYHLNTELSFEHIYEHRSEFISKGKKAKVKENFEIFYMLL